MPKEPLSQVFDNVDIFINAIGPGKSGEGHKAKAELMEAAAAAGVKVYIPSEFGMYVSNEINRDTLILAF